MAQADRLPRRLGTIPRIDTQQQCLSLGQFQNRLSRHNIHRIGHHRRGKFGYGNSLREIVVCRIRDAASHTVTTRTANIKPYRIDMQHSSLGSGNPELYITGRNFVDLSGRPLLPDNKIPLGLLSVDETAPFGPYRIGIG